MSLERSATSTRRIDGWSVAACVVLPTPKPITSTASGRLDGEQRNVRQRTHVPLRQSRRRRHRMTVREQPSSDAGQLGDLDHLGETFAHREQPFAVVRARQRPGDDVVGRQQRPQPRARHPRRASTRRPPASPGSPWRAARWRARPRASTRWRSPECRATAGAGSRPRASRRRRRRYSTDRERRRDGRRIVPPAESRRSRAET